MKTAQLDLARAAIELGVRNVFAVASWDHLSSKSELTFSPQRVFVWNEIQKKEVVRAGTASAADDVIVTGSQVFDDWFGRTPSTTRDEFCARVGLRADRPIVLYVCSSLLEGSAPEAPFVIRWAQHLRASGTRCCETAASSSGRTSGADANGETSTLDGLANIGVLAAGGRCSGGCRGRRPTTSIRCTTRTSSSA